MIEIAILLIMNALLCTGLFSAWQFEYGQTKADGNGGFISFPDENTKGILWFYKFYFLDKINYRVSKPLGNCLTCMASVFSLLPYWWYYEFQFTNIEVLVWYPFYILMLAGLNRIIDKFIND